MRTMRLRVAVVLVSVSALALELALMRMLTLRFWHHFAYMVISVSLLGFGASGTALTLLRPRVARNREAWLAGLAAAFAAATMISVRLSARVPLDVHFLAWDLRQLGAVLILELLILFPFLLAGAFIGTALMDEPRRVGGHYAANLAGSGLGAVIAVALMFLLSAEALLTMMAALAYAAALVLTSWKRRGQAIAAALGAVALATLHLAWPLEAVLSSYKRLPFELQAGGTVVHSIRGPLGRIDVVEGPSVHQHPGLAWQFMGEIPPHVVMIIDGDHASGVYAVREIADWTFMDYTTPAVAYALRREPSVCLVGAGGGAEIGLALYHGAPSVTALEMNRQVIRTMTGPLRDRGGAVYLEPGVRVVNQEARGFFVLAGEAFDVIHVPPMEAFGAAGGGMHAAQESYLYTVESITSLWRRLDEDGILLATHWMQDPPRAGLRMFETMAEALRRQGLDPAGYLALIRSRTTVTVLAARRGWDEADLDAIRRFCVQRGFDLGYLPCLLREEANQYHVLPEPYFFDAAQALLGPDREAFLAEYLFKVDAAIDDRPFFFHFFRMDRFGEFRRQLGGRVRTYLEPGYLMLLAALVQGAVLALLLIILPLMTSLRSLRGQKGRFATFGYFLMLGVGFMMLEMALLGRLILYLAHPIYAAAAVIAAFLIFAGAGSRLSTGWKAPEQRIRTRAGIASAGLGTLYALGLNHWLALSQPAPLPARMAIAALTIAPLALAMGHMFPSGLRQVGRAAPPLVPWAWATNGFASVLAAVGTPLLAMHLGFLRVGLLAAGCYLLAVLAGRYLPRNQK